MFTLTKYLKSYIPRFPRREMSFARAGKTAANEAKYPFIVEVPVAANGLNVELNGQIVGFHKSHRTRPRFGRTALRDGQIYYRWCFFDLATARVCRTVWRSVLQNDWHLTCAAPGRGGSRLKSGREPPTKLPVVDLRLRQALLAGLLKFEQVN
jgi:hypothetical protein